MNNSVNWYIATKGVLLWNQLVFEFLHIWIVNFCEKFKIIHFLIITAKELRCIQMWAQFGFTLWTKCEVYISSSHPGFRWVILPWCDINPMGRRNTTHPHMSSVFSISSLPSLVVVSWQRPRVEWRSVCGGYGGGEWTARTERWPCQLDPVPYDRGRSCSL